MYNLFCTLTKDSPAETDRSLGSPRPGTGPGAAGAPIYHQPRSPRIVARVVSSVQVCS